MTKQEIKQFLKQHNLKPIKKWGQNFLTNPQIIQKIVQRVQSHSPPFVEIGPGLGALTRHFKKENILLIERDKKLSAYWKKEGWTLFCEDALKLDWEKLPKKITLFGNLPYEIAASLIITASLRQKQIQNMLFMMQKEVAQRVMAKANSKNYGILSVISQTFWSISSVANAGKNNFYPIPKVDGRVLEFQSPSPSINLDSKDFLKFIKKCFGFKRKMLFKQISDQSPIDNKKTLRHLGFSETCRAEDLNAQDFLQLYRYIKQNQ